MYCWFNSYFAFTTKLAIWRLVAYKPVANKKGKSISSNLRKCFSNKQIQIKENALERLALKTKQTKII